ncbi:MAG TPA: PadR family transcriptional regulator [Vicinamibacterales bacterium]|nr:PadR family transcriptional regulator [Vicinamibacterales bacterium]
MGSRHTAMLKGTLDLLILRTLELQPLHGIAVADRIKQVTSGTFAVGPGSLFPALHRLEQQGWIRGAWGLSEQGRRARLYTLTSAGRKQLTAERRQWARIVAAVGQVLDSA